jgi:sec-independent protein translocase protein TatC
MADGEVRMTFGEHLEELRRRLVKAILALLVCFLVAAYFYKDLVHFIARPHFTAMALLGLAPEQSKFLSGSYTQPISAILKLAFIVGTFAASPIISYQFWKFVSSGLYPRERRFVLTFAPSSFFLFTGGCLFGYKVLIPYTLYGLSRMVHLDIISPTYTFSEYLTLVMTLTIIMGVVFEMPLLMLFLAKVGLVNHGHYNQFRRWAIVGNFVLAALLTPADVISMLVMVVPLLLLYEIGVLLSWLFARPKEKAAPEPAPQPQP